MIVMPFPELRSQKLRYEGPPNALSLSKLRDCDAGVVMIEFYSKSEADAVAEAIQQAWKVDTQ